MDSDNTQNKRFSLSLDFRLIIFFLLAIIAAMLLIWKPWAPTVKDENRVIEVTGEATVKAEPDEYVFSPSYEFKHANRETALENLTNKSDQIVSKLKELGIPDSSIKSNSSGYDYYNYYYDSGAKTNNYTLLLTVTVGDREQAQKIQDYLITTEPTGQLSPIVTFSEAKQKELESQARDEATQNARAKAEQSGKNLGFKIVGVKSVNDGAGFSGGPLPYYGRAEDTVTTSLESKQLSVQPGENELRYSVTVVYYLR